MKPTEKQQRFCQTQPDPAYLQALQDFGVLELRDAVGTALGAERLTSLFRQPSREGNGFSTSCL